MTQQFRRSSLAEYAAAAKSLNAALPWRAIPFLWGVVTVACFAVFSVADYTGSLLVTVAFVAFWIAMAVPLWLRAWNLLKVAGSAGAVWVYTGASVGFAGDAIHRPITTGSSVDNVARALDQLPEAMLYITTGVLVCVAAISLWLLISTAVRGGRR